LKRLIIFVISLIWLFISVLFLPHSVTATQCKATKPDHAPDLFQINTTKDSAVLFFTPVNNAVSQYTIVYGYSRGDERFGTSFPFGRYDGVISYTINHLAPNTKYYFRVRADHGCRQGYWSDTMSAQTNWESKIYTRVK